MNRDDLITKADLLEKTPCNFCQEVKPKFLFRATDRQYQTVPDDVWSGVVKCKNCGLIYLSPRVKEKYVGKFYSESEYYTQMPINEDGLRKLKNDLFRMIAYLYFGYPRSKINFESEFNQLLLKQWAVISFRIFPFKFHRMLPYVPGGRLLDFGFGAGNYLCRMKDLGWECWGVEKNGKNIERMRENKIKVFSDLWGPDIPKNYFDYVTAYHSLEHIYDPKAVLRRIYEITKPGGKIFIGVPNFNSVLGRFFRSYWYDLGVPIHPYIFTASSLYSYIKDAGFRGVSVYCRSLTQGLLGSMQLVFNASLELLTKKKHTRMYLRDALPLQILCFPFIKLTDWLHMGDRIQVSAVK